MNYVGHIAAGLAMRAGPAGADDEFLVGAALPDFTAMARVRLRTGIAGEIGAGSRRASGVRRRVPRLPWFLSTSRALREAMVAGGMTVGPARAAAHVMPELALDGRLIERTDVAEAVDRVLARVSEPQDSLTGLVAPHHVPRWSVGLRAIGARSDPGGYRDPRRIAERVCLATRGRPRIEVAWEHVPMLERFARALLESGEMDGDRIIRAVVG